MVSNEFLLQDRIQKIQQVINKYGEDKFYVSFSGGKDSTVVSALIDMALPNNKIPRVFANTGIEYKLIVDFVEKEKAKDHSWDLIILKPSVPIKAMLEKEGYPFKSKMHSQLLERYRRLGHTKGVDAYINSEYEGYNKQCPKKLKYQFSEDCELKISDKCCDRLKKDPLHRYQKENNKPISIVGIMAAEGGRRDKATCLTFHKKKLYSFQPLAPVSKEWEEWFINEYKIDISDIYKEPYNFDRTGCKGCPFNVDLQEALDTLDKYFPNERKQCEFIWKPVYDEYRRLNYRLKDDRYHQIDFNELSREFGLESEDK